MTQRFHVASDEEIKAGQTTDVYFVRTKEVLHAKGLDKVQVLAEVTASSLPNGWPWAVLCGTEEAARLFEGHDNASVACLPEGTIFRAKDVEGLRVPVMTIEGPYGDFCTLETPLLGMLCQATGIATAAARVRRAAGDRTVISFGIRRMHPGISPMIDRAAYIGGMDSVSSLSGAKTIGAEPVGTMPHALIVAFGDQVSAWRAYDEVLPRSIPRVALVDTYYDEKAEALMAAETLGDRLFGVRLDTPGSRRGDFEEIVREVRWELDARGFRNVKIFVSGGLDENQVRSLAAAGADGFGVGTHVSSAPTVDFALDIVERDGRPAAKRGKLGGRKRVMRCDRCTVQRVHLPGTRSVPCPNCRSKMKDALGPLVKGGKIVAELPSAPQIRRYVLSQLTRVEL